MPSEPYQPTAFLSMLEYCSIGIGKNVFSKIYGVNKNTWDEFEFPIKLIYLLSKILDEIVYWFKFWWFSSDFLVCCIDCVVSDWA